MATLSALFFALASWLFIEHWAYPRLLASLRELAERGVVLEAEPGRHAILRFCLPYWTIAGAQAVGALLLLQAKLREGTPARRGAVLALAISAGWVAAVVAFVPPGFTSVLLFSVPVFGLLLLSWLVAWPLARVLVTRTGSSE